MAEILVTGATGKTGSRVSRQLAARGVTVRAAARTPGAAGAGIVPVAFDWDDPATHGAAVDGASAAYLIPPALRLDYVPLMTAFLDRLAAAGVARAVFLSARGADASDDIPLRQVELALASSGLQYSIIRPSWFDQNFTEGFVYPGIRQHGVVAVPAGSGKVPFIDAEDIAAVVAETLTGDGHHCQAYDLSGPETLSWAEATEAVAKASGRDIAYLDMEPAEWEAAAIAMGVPPDYAGFLSFLFSAIRQGYDDFLTDGVQRVLGRQPRRFVDWAQDHGAAWS